MYKLSILLTLLSCVKAPLPVYDVHVDVAFKVDGRYSKNHVYRQEAACTNLDKCEAVCDETVIEAAQYYVEGYITEIDIYCTYFDPKTEMHKTEHIICDSCSLLLLGKTEEEINGRQ